MKIIIVGAGLSGLSTAIALRKRLMPRQRDLKIDIYDKSDAAAGWADGQGAALGLQGNGLKALESIDPELRDKVWKVGFPCTHFTHKTDTGHVLGKEYLDVLPVSRPLLIRELMRALPEGTIRYKSVKEVVTQQGLQPKLLFEDGSEESADLIIGADGIRSVVRPCIFGHDEKYKPKYQGLSAVGGVLNIELPQQLVSDPAMLFFMGATGVFGYTGLTQQDRQKLLFWSVYQTDLPPRDLQHDHATLTAKLKERHSHWTDPIIRKCLEEADIDAIYPIFIMPDLPHWGKDGVLLIGDAAHALPPRTGQGSSQAFEDALTLTLLLEANLDKHNIDDAIPLTIQGVYDVRHMRTKKLKDKALAFPEPKMPMSRTMKWFIWVLLFVLTKLAYITSYFAIVDKWDAEHAVREYLRR